MKKVLFVFICLIMASGFSILTHKTHSISKIESVDWNNELNVWSVRCKDIHGQIFYADYVSEKELGIEYEHGLCEHINNIRR